MNSTTSKSKPDNGLLNILFNIVLPVVILNKATSKFGAATTLLIALMFPLAYGLRDYWTKKKLNPVSILGLLNVLITGGLALIGLTGIWFSVKEAAFPFLIGCFVLASSFTETPFMKTMFLNPHLVDVELIEKKLDESKQHDDFERHLVQATRWLSLSFALSAAMNFFLSLRVFTPIDPALSTEAQSQILNQQIAHMTTLSFTVIVAPSMIVMLLIIWNLLRGIRQTTGLPVEQIMKS